MKKILIPIGIFNPGLIWITMEQPQQKSQKPFSILTDLEGQSKWLV